jgi:hypothetical protein
VEELAVVGVGVTVANTQARFGGMSPHIVGKLMMGIFVYLERLQGSRRQKEKRRKEY